MRRILIDQARHKRRIRHGGDRERVPLSDMEVAAEGRARKNSWGGTKTAPTGSPPRSPVKAELVKLRSILPAFPRRRRQRFLASPVLPPAGTGPTPRVAD